MILAVVVKPYLIGVLLGWFGLYMLVDEMEELVYFGYTM